MPEFYPITAAQTSVLSMESFYGGGIANITGCATLKKAVDIDDLRIAINKTFEQCDSARIRLKQQGGSFVQYFEEFEPREIETLCFTNEGDFNTWIKVLACEPFDLSGRLCKVFIAIIGEQMRVVLHFHHSVADAWTVSLFGGLIAANLQGKTINTYSYADYIAADQEYRNSTRRERDKVYWLAQFEKFSEPVYLAENLAVNVAAERINFSVSEEATKKINDFCKDNGITPYALFLNALAIYISRVKGSKNVYLGTTILNRAGKKEKYTAGIFMNTVPLLICIDNTKSILENIRENQRAITGALRYGKYPYNELLQDLRKERGFNNKLYDVMLNYQNATLDTDIVGTTKWHFCGSQGETLAIHVNDRLSEGKYYIDYDYQTDIFSQDNIEHIHRYIMNIISDIIANVEKFPQEIKMLTDEEYYQVTCRFNNTYVAYPQAKYVHKLFEEQAQKTPEACAVECEGNKYTYAQLDAKANRLANYLSKQGLQENQPVAFCTERSAEMVIGLLAILKAGAHYIPLDPTHPKERLALILEEASSSGTAPMLLTQEKLLALFPDYSGTVVKIDSENDLINCEPESAPELNNFNERSLAYIIYTSGSTGKPKGVKISHGAFSNFLLSMQKEPGITPDDALLAVTTISFDIAGLEMFLPLISGAKTIISKEQKDGIILSNLIAETGASIMQATPSTWKILLESGWEGSQNLKVLCGGEALPQELADSLLEKVAELWNMYGPTETTVWSSLCKIEKGESITIGHPIANTQLYVLNRQQQPVPFGVSGELYIGGAGVAEGYTRNDESTQGKFMANPFVTEKNSRMYKTGDLVRMFSTGQIEFLGRIDNQIKVRGYRIEVGEIENVLKSHSNVSEALVMLKASKTGVEHLVAYYTSSSSEGSENSELKAFLSNKLPDYMIPSYFVKIDKFPLTPNNKIDRKKLPDPEFGSFVSSEKFVAPRSSTEKRLAEILKELLGVEKISSTANLFNLGANSIMMAMLQNRLLKEFPNKKITIADLFQHTSIAELAVFLTGESQYEVIEELQEEENDYSNEPIAIIGMSCRFPKANNIYEFWQNIADGRECISFYSDEELEASGIKPEIYNDRNYVKASGSIEGIDDFDFKFFNYSPKEAALIDPQQRVFLEEAYHALEDAACNPETFTGDIGVYASVGMNTYHHAQANEEVLGDSNGYQLMISGDKDFLSTRVSYLLNLTGPSITIQSACSSSAVAIHTACQALRSGDCDAALAGGVSLRVPQKAGYIYNEGMILSRDGHCRAFDEKANGTVIGNGAGVVVLKPLSQALKNKDSIYAVIKGSSLNNDGSHKAHFTAPSPEKQSAVIRRAMKNAHVKPEELSYIETHGTGTELGDPIEISALTKAFISAGASKTCAIGSVKTNIGHLDSASGVAGVIKTALSIHNKQIPPSLNFEAPNPKIDFENSPFYVNTQLADWQSNQQPRTAGVSSFGIGGTNAHLILSEAPMQTTKTELSRKLNIIPVSAKTPSALSSKIADLQKYVTNNEINAADFAYTLAEGRQAMQYRTALISDDIKKDFANLEALDPTRIVSGVAGGDFELAFLFPGQGTQHLNMALGLYENEPLFKETMDECFALIKKHSGNDLKAIIYPEKANEEAKVRLENTVNTQPAIFCVEYSIAKLLLSFGITPSAMCGHSLGEYVVACLAGVLSLDDAIKLIVARARLVGNLPKGKMLSVLAEEKSLLEILPQELSIAAVNSPSNCVVSGDTESILQFANSLEEKGIVYKELKVSHAFHSAMLDPILEEFKNVLCELKLNTPVLPYVSSLTGTWILPEQATSPDFWVNHLRQTVRFNDAVETMLTRNNMVMLEVGPGRALASLVRANSVKKDNTLVLGVLPNREEETADKALYNTIASLWCVGVFDSWADFYAKEKTEYKKLHLPVYPFEKRKCWIEYKQKHSQTNSCEIITEQNESMHENSALEARSTLSVPYVEPQNENEKMMADIWQDVLGVNQIGIDDNFFELGGTSLMLVGMLTKMREKFGDLPFGIKDFYECQTIRQMAVRAQELLNPSVLDDNEDLEEGEF